MPSEARKIVESVLGSHMTSQVWTSVYTPVFPFTPQDFEVGAILPMLLYLFRWGHRRGKGRFAAAFSDGEGAPTIGKVAARLSREPSFEGFDSTFGRGVLGDVLLTTILENKRRAEGTVEPVQRSYANHYLGSWIDLPAASANLRSVPEMIAALISDQTQGDTLEPFQDRGRYRVGARVQENELLSAFAPGISTAGEYKSNWASDVFDEMADVALEQLITIRLAQACGQPPVRAVGKGEPGPVPNQRPLAARAAADLREDLLCFLDCYSGAAATPRTALISMLESAIAVGLTTIMLSTVALVTAWGQDGEIPEAARQQPFPVLVDASAGADAELRNASETSVSTFRQALARMPALLMYARLLDYYVRTEADIPRAQLPLRSPDPTQWMTLLGSLLNGSHDEARDAEKYFRSKLRALRAAADESETESPLGDIVSEEAQVGGHGRTLAELLSENYDQENRASVKLSACFTSSLMIDQPNGLAKRRKVVSDRARAKGQQRTVDAISLVLSNTALEYLVHRHLRKTGKGRKRASLSYPEFLDILRGRYGFHVDRSPPNMQVPSELLTRNREFLERRLRDLGLLTGVNDAERMKKLKPRYRAVQDGADIPAEAA